MAEQKKIQLYTDRACTVEASPETSAKCVILSDGNDLQKVLDNDLTNPTVVHEETSFKVGVGDINVSSSVVDGEVGHMVIKGKTYQNILPEPSTHVLTNNKEMFKVNEGLDPNVEIVDGVSKSAILKGQTLVNLVTNQYEINPSWNTSKDCVTIREKEVTIKLDDNTQGISVRFTPLYLLKPNTKYMIIGDVISSTSNHASNYLASYVIQWYIDGNYKGGATGISNNKRYNIFTTGSEFNSIEIACYARGFVGEVKYDFPVLLEYVDGMENWDIPYFEGMQSVKMPVLTTTGKNLYNFTLSDFDTRKGVIIHYNNSSITFTGIYTSDNLWVTAHMEKPIKLKKGTYHYSCTGQELETVYFTTEDGIKRYIGQWVVENDTEINKIHIGFRQNKNYNDVRFNIQIEEGTQTTTYEPYKSNILHTPEEVALRSFNGVKDTLNLMTGEYVQRIKEIVLNGNETYKSVTYTHNNTNLRFDLPLSDIRTTTYDGLLCDSLPVLTDSMIPEGAHTKSYIAGHADSNRIVVVVEKSKLLSENIEGFRAWLQANPITIQYELKTPIIKTVDLSSSGNWEKVILDGSEDIVEYLSGNFVYYSYGNSSITNVLPYASGGRAFANHTLTGSTGVSNLVTNYKYIVAPKTTGTTGLCFSLDGSMTAEEAKAFLSQNPITVWYQTETHKDSTQVKQPIFFKDGHIQLSSGADNSLIPTLDYQAKTSNSYVMDLMKSGTWYTMKAKSASGTLAFASNTQPLSTNGKFAVDGASFQNANKLMVINGSVEDLMVLEGDLTSKTIPYFKGIKSAFEDESKIEVLSTNKNLFDGELEMATIGTVAGEKKPSTSHVCSVNFIKVKPSSAVILTNNNGYTGVIHEYDKNYNYIKYTSSATEITKTTLTADTEYVLFRTTDASKATDLSTKFLLEVANSKTDYEPHKSNSTKIPLLSPLRSLPNGTCDEVILDRENHKVKIIQRVGEIALDGNNDIGIGGKTTASYFEGLVYLPSMKLKTPNGSYAFCDKVMTSNTHDSAINYVRTNTGAGQYLILGVCGKHLTTVDVKGVQDYLKRNPLTVYYELATPVITEVDLEGFPYIYKDGHLFLNSEIAPVVEIDYSINQSQQIQSNNETLQRHELDILDLDNLIVSFVNAEYNLRLLKFDMELSMMALAE